MNKNNRDELADKYCEPYNRFSCKNEPCRHDVLCAFKNGYDAGLEAHTESCLAKCHSECHRDQVESLKTEIENFRIKLVACGVAALSNTKETAKNRISEDSPYWSDSYADVCSGVDREINQRDQIESLQSQLAKANEALKVAVGELKSECYCSPEAPNDCDICETISKIASITGKVEG